MTTTITSFDSIVKFIDEKQRLAYRFALTFLLPVPEIGISSVFKLTAKSSKLRSILLSFLFRLSNVCSRDLSLCEISVFFNF